MSDLFIQDMASIAMRNLPSNLDERVRAAWQTNDSYTREFQESARTIPQLSFAHALLHVQKAAGRLADIVDEADHRTNKIAPERAAKYIADLIICAHRLAHTSGVNITEAVEHRLSEIEARERDRIGAHDDK